MQPGGRVEEVAGWELGGWVGEGEDFKVRGGRDGGGGDDEDFWVGVCGGDRASGGIVIGYGGVFVFGGLLCGFGGL